MTDILLPVYLNQMVVFDMAAMLNNGLATVTRIESLGSDASSKRSDLTARFGLSEALASLLSVSVGATAAESTQRSSESRQSEERVHTPASLLKRLRDDLAERGTLKTLDIQSTESGDLVEFPCQLRRNPVVQAFDSMLQFMETARLFSDSTEVSQRVGGKGGGKAKALAGPRPEDRLVEQIQGFNEKLKTGGTIDLIAEELPGNVRAVLTLQERYLNDPAMADLVDGRFRVLGKVIRVIREAEDGVSLVRKTPLGAMASEATTTLLSGFEASFANTQFALPRMEWFVRGPVVHVLPVGIYV